MLELRNLGSFVVLAEELNYTRAAERLGITQSALTYRIQRLEEDLGAVLIERGSRRSWHLTPAGAHLFREVREGLGRLETALADVQRLGNGEAGELLIGIVPTIAPALLTRALAGFRSELPGVGVSFRELAVDEQFAEIQRGRLDAGLVRAHEPAEGLWLDPVLNEPLAAALPPDHELAETAAQPLRALQDQPFVVVGRGADSPSRRELVARCRDHAFSPRIVAEAPLAVALELVEAGHGVALLPASVLTDLRAQLAIVPIEDTHTEIHIATNPGRQNLAIATFAKAVLRAGRRLGSDLPRQALAGPTR